MNTLLNSDVHCKEEHIFQFSCQIIENNHAISHQYFHEQGIQHAEVDIATKSLIFPGKRERYQFLFLC